MNASWHIQLNYTFPFSHLCPLCMRLHTADGVPTNSATNQHGPRLIPGMSFPFDTKIIFVLEIEVKNRFQYSGSRLYCL